MWGVMVMGARAGGVGACAGMGGGASLVYLSGGGVSSSMCTSNLPAPAPLGSESSNPCVSGIGAIPSGRAAAAGAWRAASASAGRSPAGTGLSGG